MWSGKCVERAKRAPSLQDLDEIWVRDTVNTNFMEGVLLVVSTGFAPGSIYGSTFALSTLLPSSQYGGLASYQEFRAHNLLESGTEAGGVCGAWAACVEPQQRGSCVSTPGTPDMILKQSEAGSISTQCSVSSKGKMLNEEDTRLGR